MGILLQTFNQVVIVAQFYANRDFIAKNLCENRAKPERKCCGKCYLSKQLNKADDTKSSNVVSKLVLEEVTCFVLPVIYCIPFVATTTDQPLKAGYESVLLTRPPGAVFRPPSC